MKSLLRAAATATGPSLAKASGNDHFGPPRSPSQDLKEDTVKLRTKIAPLFVAAVMAGGVLTVAAPSAGAAVPVPASAADCEGGRNGFRDIPDNASGVGRGSVGLPGDRGISVSLETADFGDGQRGFAHLTGNLGTGDAVWMDWTRDGGQNWIQCGPFWNGAGKSQLTSAAQRTSSDTNWRFRACGQQDEAGIRCTNWW